MIVQFINGLESRQGQGLEFKNICLTCKRMQDYESFTNVSASSPSEFYAYVKKL